MIHPAPPTDWDSTSAPDRRCWIEHAAVCSECRDSWIAGDPSRVFTLLADCPVVDEVVEQEALLRLSADIRREMRSGRPAGRLVRLAAAAVLAAALLAPSAAWLLRDRPDAGVQTVAVAEPVLPLAVVEFLSSPGEARVVDLSVGDTQVVMIFDPRLEL